MQTLKKMTKQTLMQLFEENLDVAIKAEELAAITNAEPPAKWVKEHPYIKGWKYIPIDKVEYLLKRIFKNYRIEIKEASTAFNGVVVIVRVHYLSPATGEWEYHDGIGACQLQTAKGTSPADLANINNGALSMAYPIAKTYALKDACDHFGKLFGSDLNRKDAMPHQVDEELLSRKQAIVERKLKAIKNANI